MDLVKSASRDSVPGSPTAASPSLATKPRPRGRPKRMTETAVPEVVEGIEPQQEENYDEYLFYIRTAQASCIKAFIEAIRDDVHNIPMMISYDGIHIYVNDPGKNVNISIDLHQKQFDSRYWVKQPVTFYVDSHNLHKLFKIINTTSRVAFFMSDTPKNETLDICIDSVSGGDTLNYHIKIDLDVKPEDLGKPIIPEGEMISLSSTKLIGLCKHLGGFSEQVDIQKFESDLTLKVSYECGEIDANLPIVINPAHETGTAIKNRYKLKDITEFSKCSSLSKTVSLYISNEFPLTIEYNVGILGTLRIGITSVEV